MTNKAVHNIALERLNTELDTIPFDNEWWKEATRDRFRRAGQQMLGAGMMIEVIVPLLRDLYYATAGEFGG